MPIRSQGLSPGFYLMQKSIEALASAGVHTVISHGAHEYKRHWATAFVPQKRVLLFAAGLRAAAARFVRFSLAPKLGIRAIVEGPLQPT